MVTWKKRDPVGFINEVDKILRKYSKNSADIKIINAAKSYGLKEEYLELMDDSAKVDEVVFKISAQAKEQIERDERYKQLQENNDAYKMF